MICKNARPSNAVKKRFITEVNEIVWQYKLSQDTINLAPKDGVMEIQVFKITLKDLEVSKEVLKVIDKAIPYPIFCRLLFEDRLNRVAAYKRISATNTDNCVIGDYFETGWTNAPAPEIPLPVALNLKSLLELYTRHQTGSFLEKPKDINVLRMVTATGGTPQNLYLFKNCNAIVASCYRAIY